MLALGPSSKALQRKVDTFRICSINETFFDRGHPRGCVNVNRRRRSRNQGKGRNDGMISHEDTKYGKDREPV
jgi:hypothetical protein